MPTNRYQANKVGNEIVAVARKVFGALEFRKVFNVIAITQIQDANGKDEAIKVEMNVPGHPKAMHTMHIPVMGYRPDNKPKWQAFLHQQALDAQKRMRMMKSRSKEVRELDEVDGGP
jgi:hypothetical protein